MTAAAALERGLPAATDGVIAAINHDSARRRAWQRFALDAREEDAEAIVEAELLSVQFFGDVDALDRIELLAARLPDGSALSALIEARVASAAHRFADARRHLADAALRGALPDAVRRQLLSVDQACGTNLDEVLEARLFLARSGRTEDLVPLGALLADAGEFARADRVYCQALEAYDDVSPFPLAWACFQLGMLWGEEVPEPDLDLAAGWYRSAIDYLPGYSRARVHLAEILMRRDRSHEARTLLEFALATADPEVEWRLADVLLMQDYKEEGRIRLRSARERYERLLDKHFLAFADHAAEFYSGSGNDAARALELARANAANRPTRRALAQVLAIQAAVEAAS
jgi:hypothetical protein